MDQIKEIQNKANREIYYIIKDRFFEVEKEINSNYNMGLITLSEKLEQTITAAAKVLKDFKSYNIDEFTILQS